jgi:hypothetical protein
MLAQPLRKRAAQVRVVSTNFMEAPGKLLSKRIKAFVCEWYEVIKCAFVSESPEILPACSDGDEPLN